MFSQVGIPSACAGALYPGARGVFASLHRPSPGFRPRIRGCKFWQVVPGALCMVVQGMVETAKHGSHRMGDMCAGVV